MKVWRGKNKKFCYLGLACGHPSCFPIPDTVLVLGAGPTHLSADSCTSINPLLQNAQCLITNYDPDYELPMPTVC